MFFEFIYFLFNSMNRKRGASPTPSEMDEEMDIVVCMYCCEPYGSRAMMEIRPCGHPICSACCEDCHATCICCDQAIESYATTKKPKETGEEEEEEKSFTLQDLKNIRIEDRDDWLCPVCMSPYDNVQCVPMRVAQCTVKKPNPYKQEDLGVKEGCGHVLCERCSLRSMDKPCCMCRAHVLSFGPDLELLQEIVSHADGLYLAMAVQYNESAFKLEPVMEENKKLKDGMKPKDEEIARLVVFRDRVRQLETNLAEQARLAISESQKVAQLEKEAREYNEKLDVQKKKVHSLATTNGHLFVDLIKARVSAVSAGILDPADMGLVVSDGRARNGDKMVLVTVALGPPHARNETAGYGKPRDTITKADDQTYRIIQKYQGASKQTLEEAAPACVEDMQKDYIRHKGDKPCTFLRVGSWTDRMLRSRDMATERVFDGDDDNDTGGVPDALYRPVSDNAVYMAMERCVEIGLERKRVAEEKAALDQERQMVRDSLVRLFANSPVVRAFSVKNTCVSCMKVHDEDEAFALVLCMTCKTTRCDSNCAHDPNVHACRSPLAFKGKYGNTIRWDPRCIIDCFADIGQMVCHFLGTQTPPGEDARLGCIPFLFSFSFLCGHVKYPASRSLDVVECAKEQLKAATNPEAFALAVPLIMESLVPGGKRTNDQERNPSAERLYDTLVDTINRANHRSQRLRESIQPGGCYSEKTLGNAFCICECISNCPSLFTGPDISLSWVTNWVKRIYSMLCKVRDTSPALHLEDQARFLSDAYTFILDQVFAAHPESAPGTVHVGAVTTANASKEESDWIKAREAEKEIRNPESIDEKLERNSSSQWDQTRRQTATRAYAQFGLPPDDEPRRVINLSPEVAQQQHEDNNRLLARPPPSARTAAILRAGDAQMNNNWRAGGGPVVYPTHPEVTQLLLEQTRGVGVGQVGQNMEWVGLPVFEEPTYVDDLAASVVTRRSLYHGSSTGQVGHSYSANQTPAPLPDTETVRLMQRVVDRARELPDLPDLPVIPRNRFAEVNQRMPGATPEEVFAEIRRELANPPAHVSRSNAPVRPEQRRPDARDGDDVESTIRMCNQYEDDARRRTGRGMPVLRNPDNISTPEQQQQQRPTGSFMSVYANATPTNPFGIDYRIPGEQSTLGEEEEEEEERNIFDQVE